MKLLKLSLWKKFEHDRDGYTEAKTDFIRKYTNLAKKFIWEKILTKFFICKKRLG